MKNDVYESGDIVREVLEYVLVAGEVLLIVISIVVSLGPQWERMFNDFAKAENQREQ